MQKALDTVLQSSKNRKHTSYPQFINNDFFALFHSFDDEQERPVIFRSEKVQVTGKTLKLAWSLVQHKLAWSLV